MRRFFTLLTIVSMLFAACEGEPVTPNEPIKPEIILEKAGIITMPAAGGEAEICYTILNPVDGLNIEAKSNVDWICDIATGESITFTVERNHGEQRVGIVTLHYGDAEVGVGIQQNEALASGDVRLSIRSERKTIFEATGGRGTISYMLECEEEGAIPEVTTDVDWIAIDAITSDTISYTVARSLVEQNRTGHITLNYSGKRAEATIEQKAAELLPILSAERNIVRTDESLTLKVEYAEQDVTAEATIHDYYTNDEITNPFQPTESGERVFYAKYNNRRSKVLTIYVVPADAPVFPEDSAPESFDFNQRMLIVDHTGTGCGYCPNMKSALKSLDESDVYGNKINIVYAYSFSTGEACYSKDASTLWQYYKAVCSTNKVGMTLTGYPSATLNYCVDYAANPSTVQSQIDTHWVENPSAGVALSADIKDGKIYISTEVKSSIAQNIHLALWLLEDDIYAYQSGGSAEWMNTHHSVLRQCLTGASKSDISGMDIGYVKANNSIQRVYEFELPTANNWVSDNLKVIAIISAVNADYDNRYEVINTAMCEIGATAEYEYK